GTATLTVWNPAPGGGPSGPLTFTILGNPTPSIFAVSPSFVLAGAGGSTVTIQGTGFVSTSVAQWNGANRQTTVLFDRLIASILATDLQTPGTAQVRVFNPGPGGGVSNAIAVTILEASPPQPNPVPAITSIDP